MLIWALRNCSYYMKLYCITHGGCQYYEQVGNASQWVLFVKSVPIKQHSSRKYKYLPTVVFLRIDTSYVPHSLASNSFQSRGWDMGYCSGSVLNGRNKHTEYCIGFSLAGIFQLALTCDPLCDALSVTVRVPLKLHRSVWQRFNDAH